jgi:hypothetical protein
VEGNQVQLVRSLSQKLGRSPSDEGVADAVEPVLAQLAAVGNSRVDRVSADVRGDGRVELTVEAGNVAGAGKVTYAGLDDAEAVGVVERGQFVEAL